LSKLSFVKTIVMMDKFYCFYQSGWFGNGNDALLLFQLFYV